MKIKRLVSFGSALLLSLVSLFALYSPHAFAASMTWDGGGGDANLATAANWAGDVAPTAGDDLIFPAGAPQNTITNDFLAGTSFNSITFSGVVSGSQTFTISGNALTVVAGITSTMSGDFGWNIISAPIMFNGAQSITTTATSPISLEGVLSGSSALTKAGAGQLELAGNNTFTGTLAINAGSVSSHNDNALGTAAGGTTVASGAELDYCFSSDFTAIEPLTLAGNGTDPSLTVAGCGGAGALDKTVTLSGNIILQSNVLVGGFNGNKAKITGGLSGSFTIGMASGQDASLEIASSSNTSQSPNGTYTSTAKETTYSSNSPSTDISVGANEVAIVTGTYRNVDVSGILKGTGTVGTVTVQNGGKVAPGMSPGCINSGNLTLTTGSSYDFEVGGTTACTEYDQMKVTGTVNVTDATLNTILYNGFKPVKGQSYTIISNDAVDAVTGTFSGMAEGATFTVSGYVFKISYTGGDGNDVVLTVQSVPAAPNTGFALAATHPFVTLALTVMSSAGLVIIARRLNRSSPR